MVDYHIIQEIIALGSLRVQKIFALYNSVLVLELYSKLEGRLFLVFDANAKTRTFHVQKERPAGIKHKSALVDLLNKYILNRSLKFYKLDDECLLVKAIIINNQDKLALIFEFFPRFSLGFFRDGQQLAVFNKGLTVNYRRGFISEVVSHLGLAKNYQAAHEYKDKIYHYRTKEIYDKKIVEIKRELNKKTTLLKNVMSDLHKCEQSLASAKDAELLRNNMHLLTRGMKEVTLTDYSVDPPVIKTISLDQRMSPAAFLEKCFNKVKRAKRGFNIISARLIEINNDINHLKERLKNIEEKGPQGIVLEEIIETPILKTKSKKTSQRLPYKSYTSSDQIKILVGRSAKDSDDLTLHYAHGNEWWLHARDVAGAHVVIKTKEDIVPKKTLLEAAMLAAHFSKDKNNPKTTIQYTRVKFVRKQRGLAPGQVLIAKEKTIDIVMDIGQLQAIMNTEEKSN